MRCCRAIQAALLLPVFLALGGCGGMPAYQAVQTVPHKDVVSLVVYLEGRCSAEVYRRIALDEAARIAREGGPDRPPLYEVKVLFVVEGPEPERLAQVNVIHAGAPAEAASSVARAVPPRVETTLY